MHGLGLVAVTGVAIAVVLRGSLRAALATTFGVLLLIPGFLPVPNPWSPNITIGRLVVVAFIVRLFLDTQRGVVPLRVFRPDRVLLSLLVFLGIATGDGLLLADHLAGGGGAFRWWQIVDFVLVYTAALAGLRAINDRRWVIRLLASLAVALAGIAILERLILSDGYAHWWYGRRAGPSYFGSQSLEVRGGLRVRASAAFALEFGWVCALLMPVVACVSAGSRRLAVRAAPGALTLAAVWTVSRSGLAGLGAGLLVTLALSKLEADLTRYILVLIAVAAIGVVIIPSIAADFRHTRTAQEASTQARTNRWPEAAAAAAISPVTGRGLGTLKGLGIQSVDNSYLLTYVEMGVVGLVGLVGVLAAALLTTFGSLRGPPDAARRREQAAMAAIPILAVAGAWAYDLFALPLSQAIVWIAVAMCATAEQRPSMPRHVVRPTIGAVLVVIALVLGLVVRTESASHASSRYVFETLSPNVVAVGSGPALVTGTVLAETACDLVEVEKRRLNDVQLRCRIDGRAQGLGELWIQTRDPATTEVVADDIATRVHKFLPEFRMRRSEAIAEGPPSPAQTAPVWLPMLAVWLLALVPWRRRATPSALTSIESGPGPLERTAPE
jgi:O-antigen ligase